MLSAPAISPPRLNRTQAHLTLFHALPRLRFAQILPVLSGVGRGVQEARQIRDAPRGGWLGWLGEQDPGGGELEARLDGYE
jgi:hypothetical protein